jgi:hypothetical protein
MLEIFTKAILEIIELVLKGKNSPPPASPPLQ